MMLRILRLYIRNLRQLFKLRPSGMLDGLPILKASDEIRAKFRMAY